MIKKANFLAIGALLVIATIAAAFSNNSDSENVERRFQQYMDAWKKNDIEKVWDMMSPDLKEGNDDSLAKYREFAMQQGVRPSGYKIRKITVNNNIAVIETEIQARDFYGKNLGSDWEECKFINIDEIWYFDDCKLIDP